MPRPPKKATSTAFLGFEAKLWFTADKLRNCMDAAEYKRVVLSLVFLNYISDAFEDRLAKLLNGECNHLGPALDMQCSDERSFTQFPA